MTFETLALIVTPLGVIGTWLCYLLAHKTYKMNRQLVKQIHEAEWSLTRRDYDEWLLERMAPGKLKVYGYSMNRSEGQYESILKKFENPATFVEGSKWVIQGELDGEGWDLIVYYSDFYHVEKNDSGQFPKDADIWVYPLT